MKILNNIIFISVLGIEFTHGLVRANALLLSYMVGPETVFLKYDWITLLPLPPAFFFFFFSFETRSHYIVLAGLEIAVGLP